jgi:hypothetical protein
VPDAHSFLFPDATTYVILAADFVFNSGMPSDELATSRRSKNRESVWFSLCSRVGDISSQSLNCWIGNSVSRTLPINRRIRGSQRAENDVVSHKTLRSLRNRRGKKERKEKVPRGTASTTDGEGEHGLEGFIRKRHSALNSY